MKGAMIASIITTVELFIIMALHATRSDSSRDDNSTGLNNAPVGE